MSQEHRTYLAAHKSTALKAKLAQGNIQKVKFEIVDKTGKTLTSSDDLQLTNEKAEWNWTPNTDNVKTLPDTEDTIDVTAQVLWYKPDGSAGDRVPVEQFTIFRDAVKIKVLSADNKAVTDASVNLMIEKPKATAATPKLPTAPADAQGIVSFDNIPQWTSLKVVVGGKWAMQNSAAPWKPGKEKGLDREITVIPKTYKAGFLGIRVPWIPLFNPIPEIGETRIQYVNFNFDQKTPPIAQGETVSHYGHTIVLQIGATEPGQFAGLSIYVKFEADAGNSKRNAPKPGLFGMGKQPDADGILELTLDNEGRATCEVELGFAGGDKFALKISSIKDFAGTIDQTLTFENWRKLFYELMAPAKMGAGLAAATLPEETAGPGPHFDLPAAVRDSLKKVLDPVFVKFELTKSFMFADNLSRQEQLAPAQALGRTETRDLYIGSEHTIKPSQVSFTDPREPHTVRMLLCDMFFEGAVLVSRQAVTMEAAEQEIAPSQAGHLFLPPAAINSSNAHDNVVEPNPEWEAVIKDPSVYKNAPGVLPLYSHPGLDANGKPRKGTLLHACFLTLSATKVKIHLPPSPVPEPGGLVGTESGLKCPIKVTFALNEATPANGGYAKGQLIAILNPRNDIATFTLAHELGHAMNMTMMTANDVPPGMDAPKHVDEGGTYYRDGRGSEVPGKVGVRTPAKGEHCATGLATKTVPDYPKETPEGACVMYGFAPPSSSAAKTDTVPFCTVCIPYVKAQDLTKLYK